MAATRRTSGKAAERALAKWGQCPGQTELFAPSVPAPKAPAKTSRDPK